MAMIQLADFASQLELAESVQRERQVSISLNSRMIEPLAFVRFDQALGLDRVGNLAKRRIAHLDRAVKRLLLWSMEPGSSDQGDARIAQRLAQGSAGHRIETVAPEPIGCHEEPVRQAQV